MIRLREAMQADLESFYRLDQLCFPAGIAYSRREFRNLLRSPEAVRVVADEDGAVAGFAIARLRRNRGATFAGIVTIDVDPGFRRRGVGRLLMEHIEKQAQAAGAQSLQLEVAVDNLAAQTFYARLGFQSIGRVLDYYGDSLHAIVMEKGLTDTSVSSPDCGC